jgi:DNA repair protein RecO (recombination protein O)
MHTDAKMIIKIYTKSFGTISYLDFRSSKKKHTNLFLPMSLIEFTGERKNKANFDYIKDPKILATPDPIQFDIVKSSISMFLNEALYKLLFDAAEDGSLFDFLFSSLTRFFCQTMPAPDFHLRFLVALMQELGSSPKDNYSSEYAVFSVEKSCFEAHPLPNKEHQMLSLYMHRLLQHDLFPDSPQDIIPYPYRNPLLELILRYYSTHIANLSQMKSHTILKTVLHT